MAALTNPIARRLGWLRFRSANQRTPQAWGGWHWLGLGVSVAVLACACVALAVILRDIDTSVVWAAMLSASWTAIALAAGLIAAGYVTLTLYDFLSLKAIGRHDVPYPVAALASFASYSIGHSTGATVFVAAAVRWRVYSRWRLSVGDIAKMAFLTGLGFWLGNITLLAVGMALVPHGVAAVNHLSVELNRWIGIVGVMAVAAYLLWLTAATRTVGAGDWSIRLPGAGLSSLQISIGVLDLSLGGLALYVLLPADAAIDPMMAIVIYASALIVGFISHTPGSLGVFEAAILLAMPHVDREPLLASLLIFRLLYFVLPLIVSLALMVVREISMAAAKEPSTPVKRAAL